MRIEIMTEQKKILTPAEFRNSLRQEGRTLKEWAEDRGFDPQYCSRVLNGMVKGSRGKGHEIAVKMGIK